MSTNGVQMLSFRDKLLLLYLLLAVCGRSSATVSSSQQTGTVIPIRFSVFLDTCHPVVYDTALTEYIRHVIYVYLKTKRALYLRPGWSILITPGSWADYDSDP